MRCAKILIAEDDRAVAKGIKDALTGMGCTVIGVVSTGKAALQKVKTLKPDVILMDIMLDGEMDGIETTKQIRKKFNIPVIYLTAYSDEKKVKRAELTEPYGYILKPFQPQELYAAISMALKKHKAALEFKQGAEEALKESEEKWRSLVENAPNHILIVDRDHVIQFINRPVRGHSIKDMVGRKLYYFIEPPYQKKARETINRVFKTGKPGMFESKVIIPNAGTFWFETFVGPIKSEGKIVASTLINVDVTERKKSKGELQKAHDELEVRIQERTKELKKANETLQAEIIERKQVEEDLLKVKLGIKHSDQAILITDTKGVISYVNPAFEKTYGYKASEALGKTPRILKSGQLSDNFYKNLWKNLLNKKAISTEMINKTKDGRFIHIKQSANPIIGEDGKIIGFLAIQSDITKTKQMEGELEKKVQDLEKFSRITVGRELKMVELKKKIKELEKKLTDKK